MVPQEVKQCCAFTYHGAYIIIIETVIGKVRAPLLLQRWNMHNNVIMISEGIRWHGGKESAHQCQRHKRRSFSPWVGKMPWRKKWQPTPVFLLGKSHGQRLAGYSPQGWKRAGHDCDWTTATVSWSNPVCGFCLWVSHSFPAHFHWIFRHCHTEELWVL